MEVGRIHLCERFLYVNSTSLWLCETLKLYEKFNVAGICNSEDYLHTWIVKL